jgi:hypothetical protein
MKQAYGLSKDRERGKKKAARGKAENPGRGRKPLPLKA